MKLMKERKAVYYVELKYVQNGLVHTFDVYGIFKKAMTINEAIKNNLMDMGVFNALSYSEKQKIAKDTIINEAQNDE